MPRLKERLLSLFAFLIGLLACTDSIYFILVGETPILWVYVVSMLLIGFLLIYDQQRLITALSRFSNWYWLFIGCCFFSIIPMLVTFVYQPQVFRSFFTGQITLLLTTTVYGAVLCLHDRLALLYRGVWWGIIANVVMAALQYFGFATSRFISLYSWFPQRDYIVALPWAAQLKESAAVNFLTIYRASGLFLETSYYVIFLVAALVVTLYFQKITLWHWLILFLLFSFLIISSSANTVVLLGLLGIFFWIQRGHLNAPLTYSMAAILVIVTGILVGACVYYATDIIKFFASNNLIGSVIDSFKTLNLRDQGNQERYHNMQTALSLYEQHWFGVGFNMLPTYLELTVGKLLRASSAFNWFINLLLELGPVGLGVYCLMLFDWIRRNFNAGRLGRLLSYSIIGIAMMQFGNGVKLFPIFMLIFATATGNV